jgi:uncharacterized protein (TIGR02600 family)
MEPQPNQLKYRPSNGSRRGIALVLVLVFLVLLTGLLLAFFSSATLNLAASSSYANGASTRQLSDSAVSYAMSQIATATSGTNVAWASQPGMIRTYDQSGEKLAFYKLYSSDQMVVTGKSNINAYQLSNDLKVNASDSITSWASRPAIFTDLNAPYLDATGASSYPIVDPTAVADGFNLTNDPANNPTVSSAGANQAPMPVKWLYILKSGELTAPSSVDISGKVASWDKVTPVPSASNPIVGRIAFWTDDESCKLNLNTTSEPTPWATPQAVTLQDLNFGKYQPAQKEYQRYPGHPFTTALSPVLYPGLTSDLTAAQLKSIYDWIPRVQWGGSQAATTDVTKATTVTPDQDRLFASVDEALFASPGTTGPARAANTPTAQFQTTLEKARFFLTTKSSAPEVNLFGQPRISIWPVPQVADPNNLTSTESQKQTAYDRLARFCSTIGNSSTLAKKPFCFQRVNAYSPTEDYLNIPRNQDLYKYLQALTSQAIPGYGGDFLTKWGNDRDQVLTEIFDYIRSTNLRDPLLVQSDPASGTALIASKQPYVYAAAGQVAPIQINSTQGFGRFHTISQFGLHFLCGATNSNGTPSGRNDTLKVTTGGATTNYTTDPAQVDVAPDKPKLLPLGQSMVEASFFFEPFSPSVGFYQLQESICYVVTFKNGMSIDGNNLYAPNFVKTVNSSEVVGWNSGFTAGIPHADGRAWGGGAGIRGPIKQLDPFISNKVLAGSSANPGIMKFSGGTVEVKVYSGTAPNIATAVTGNLIQTFTITFPPADFPVPALVTTGTDANWRGTAKTTAQCWWSLDNWTDPNTKTKYVGSIRNLTTCPHVPGAEYADPTRRWSNDPSNNPPGFKWGGLFRAEDVVRTMVPINGDLRLIAATANPGTLFAKGNNYDNTKVRFDHLISEPEGTHMLFGFSNEPGPGTDPAVPLAADATSGIIPIKGTAWTDQLIPSQRIRYHYARLPEIRPGAGKLYNQWNDFDNGTGYIQDGAYINKPDEGNISSTGTNVGATTYPYYGWKFDIDTAKQNFFSPCRLVPSAGMFGSLPTGVIRGRPWETLLFRPYTPSSVLTQTGTHTGSQTPKDHLIMDLFWMPVIEPYAISEPFATAGKVNLNYQIAPFSYIRRATALYGAFKSEQPLILPNSDNPTSNSPGSYYTKIYKLWKEHTNDDYYPNDAKYPSNDTDVATNWGKLFNGQAPFDKLRRPIDMTETLKQADDRFNGVGAYDSRFAGSPDIFRSATEICELHLVRQSESLSDYTSGKIWDSALMTGDNTRERPYTNLYAKLTTRSNVYTVHLRVQGLRKSKGSDPTQWDESKDQVVGEYRGSALIERYIDPGDPLLVDYATTSGNLNARYKFRVLSTKKFP